MAPLEKGISNAPTAATTTGLNGTGYAPSPAYRGHPQHYDNHNPMQHIHSGEEPRLPAFGGEFQPGLYRSVESRKFANPAPLGLSAFALTTFVLSSTTDQCVNGFNSPQTPSRTPLHHPKPPCPRAVPGNHCNQHPSLRSHQFIWQRLKS